MELNEAIEKYKRNIEKLAEKNNVDYDTMEENWSRKFEDFQNITDDYGFEFEHDIYEKNEINPFIAMTINGSILIVSEITENDKRKVRYQSIKIRTDESKNVPEIFEGVLKEDISINKKAVFDNMMETSPIIIIKSSDNFDWDSFEKAAEELTFEFTKKFELIDKETITKVLEQS